MGKQILEIQEVKLIKHLLHNENWKTSSVANFIPLVSHKQIYRIKKGIRWDDIYTPALEFGRELYYRYFRKKTLRNE